MWQGCGRTSNQRLRHKRSTSCISHCTHDYHSVTYCTCDLLMLPFFAIHNMIQTFTMPPCQTSHYMELRLSICFDIRDQFQMRKDEFTLSPILGLDSALSLIESLCSLLLRATRWNLNAQACVDMARLAGRTIQMLLRIHMTLAGSPIRQDLPVAQLSEQDLVRFMPCAFVPWGNIATSVDKLGAIRQELSMAIGLMKLMKHTNDYQ